MFFFLASVVGGTFERGSPLGKEWVSLWRPISSGKVSPVKIPTVAGSTVFPISRPELACWSLVRG